MKDHDGEGEKEIKMHVFLNLGVSSIRKYLERFLIEMTRFWSNNRG